MEQKKHKHYDAIIAFANGSTIEWRDKFDWEDIDNPGFYEEFEYRVKPKIVKRYINLYKDLDNRYFLGPTIYVDEEIAKNKAYTATYVKTIEIEEEENARIDN